KLARDSGAVEIDERLTRPPAVRMNPIRQDRLSRAGLAANEDRAVCAEDRLRFLAQLADGGTGAEERIDAAAHFVRCRAGARLLAVALVVDDAVDHDQQRVELYRL